MDRGMTLDLCTSYFYYVKPLHVVGSIVKRDDIRSYWRRLMPQNWIVIRDYMDRNIHIINALNDRK